MVEEEGYVEEVSDVSDFDAEEDHLLDEFDVVNQDNFVKKSVVLLPNRKTSFKRGVPVVNKNSITAVQQQVQVISDEKDVTGGLPDAAYIAGNALAAPSLQGNILEVNLAGEQGNNKLQGPPSASQLLGQDQATMSSPNEAAVGQITAPCGELGEHTMSEAQQLGGTAPCDETVGDTRLATLQLGGNGAAAVATEGMCSFLNGGSRRDTFSLIGNIKSPVELGAFLDSALAKIRNSHRVSGDGATPHFDAKVGFRPMPEKRSRRRATTVDKDMVERAAKLLAKKNLEEQDSMILKNSFLSLPDMQTTDNVKNIGIYMRVHN